MPRDHVTGHKLSRLNLAPLASMLDLHLGGKQIYERLDSVTSVAFFVETDG